MKRKQNAGSSYMKCIVVGGVISVAITLLSSLVIATMLNSGIIEEKTMGYGVMIALILAAFGGSFYTCKKQGSQLLKSGLLTAATYILLMLFINLIAFDAEFNGVCESILLILTGSMLAIMWNARRKNQGKHIKRKIINC